MECPPLELFEDALGAVVRIYDIGGGGGGRKECKLEMCCVVVTFTSTNVQRVSQRRESDRETESMSVLTTWTEKHDAGAVIAEVH